MSGQSAATLRTFAELGERFLSDDRPKIPLDDPLLAALKLAHGEAGRPDLAIPRTAPSTPNR
jgi:hypothetical protein